MPRRKLLMVGLGSIGQRHVRNLRALCGDELDLLAYRVRREGRVLGERMEVASDSGLEEKYAIRAFDRLDAALDEEPQAVLICNPTALHLEVLEAAVARDVHVFVEKPVAESVEGLDAIAQDVEAKRLVALVGFQMRFHPCFRRARQLLTEHRIGRVVAARLLFGEWLPGFHPWEDYRNGYAARRDLGGGVVRTLIHEVDAAFALFGMPRAAFALGGHRSSLELDVEDVASALLDCAPAAVHVQLDYLEKPGRRQWDIVGDRGRIEADLATATLRHVDAAGTSTVESFDGFDRNQLFLDEMRHFLACLDGRETPVVSFRDGIQSQRIAAAILESMKTGRSVDLP